VELAKVAHTTERRSQVPAPASCQAGIPENPKTPRTLQSWSTFSTSQATYQVARAAERFLAWLKGGFRWLGLRYERLSSTFAAMVYLASFPTSLGGF
jgi:hypothetical protein